MRISIMSLLLGLVIATPLRAETRYFLVMFSGQREDADPKYAHTWATFVEVHRAAPCHPEPRISAFTISWLPANLDIRVYALLAEKGANLDYRSTIEFMHSNRARVSLWGPYEIRKKFYCQAKEQYDYLQSGKVKYKAVDSGRLNQRVSNCMHAVSSIAEQRRVRLISPSWGETASWIILFRFRRYLVDRDCIHEWVGSALGLDEYPIIYRRFEPPRTGKFRGPISRVLGRQSDHTPSFGPPARR